MAREDHRYEEGYEDEYYEDEYYEEEEEEFEETYEEEDPVKRYIGIYGSSTLFHILLLALLGIITIGSPPEEKGEVQVALPEDNDKMEFDPPEKKHDVKSPVEKEKTVKNPKVAEKQSDHNEEDVNKKFNEDVGESKDFKSDANMQSKQWNSAIGLGGGAGGNFGGGRGGDEDLGALGGSGKTQNAVLAALKWLARHQADDGHWDVYGYRNKCERNDRSPACKRRVESSRTEYNVGVTGLALLAFLGAGYTHLSTDKVFEGYNFGKVVLRGLKYLKDQQNSDGSFVEGGKKPMYNNSLATLAYAEAYGMTASAKLQDIAQQAVNYIQKAQNEAPSGTGFLGWRYEANSGDNDTSVTGWCAMALKSAQLAGLSVGGGGLEGAVNWVEKVTNEDYGRTAYRNVNNVGLKVADEHNRNFANHPSMTSIGMLVRMFVNQDPDSPVLKKGAQALMEDLPKWDPEAKPDDKGNPIDYYYWYYASLAIYMYAGPDSPNSDLGYWEEWNSAMKQAVLPSQEKEGDEHGSWDPVARWSHTSGRVYSTAINALTLEVYYRYGNAFGVGDSGK